MTYLQAILWEVSQHPNRVGENQMQVFCAYRESKACLQVKPTLPSLGRQVPGCPRIYFLEKIALSKQESLRAAWPGLATYQGAVMVPPLGDFDPSWWDKEGGH